MRGLPEGPSWATATGTFRLLVAGFLARPGRRTVTGMLTGAGATGATRTVPVARAYRFFTRAVWCPDRLGLVLADLIITGLVPAGAPVTVAVDDTLLRRSGRRVHAAA